MFIAKGFQNISITGFHSGRANADAPVVYKKLTTADSMIMFFALRSNSEHLAPFFPWGESASQYDFATVQRYCVVHQDDPKSDHYIFYSNGQFIGQGSLSPIGGVDLHRQVVLWVDKRVRGKGFASKIVKKLEAIAFQELGTSVLFYTHDVANVASQRVAEKCDFEPHCSFEQEPKAIGETGKYLCWAKDNPLASF
jgi:RimJ/RimL family protein N-acetyltransferase